ncbi:MAG TPA: hypothetical protein VGH87_01185, partial [Polyangiaceae bacterium]
MRRHLVGVLVVVVEAAARDDAFQAELAAQREETFVERAAYTAAPRGLGDVDVREIERVAF